MNARTDLDSSIYVEKIQRRPGLELTAETVYEIARMKGRIAEDLKEATRVLATLYSGSVRVEINVGREHGEPKVSITEFNL